MTRYFISVPSMLIFSMRPFSFSHRFSSTSIFLTSSSSSLLSSSPPHLPLHSVFFLSTPLRLLPLHLVFFTTFSSSSPCLPHFQSTFIFSHFWVLRLQRSCTWQRGFFPLDRVEEKDLHYNLLYDTSQEHRKTGKQRWGIAMDFFNAESSTVLAISLPRACEM